MQEISRLPEGKTVQFDLYLRGARKFDTVRFPLILDELRKRRFFDRAFFACFSDHGEGFYPRSPWLSHSGALTEEVVRIPLFVWSSEQQEGRRIDQAVSLVDLAPTALAVACRGRTPPEGLPAMDGIDLTPALSGGRLPPRVLYEEVWRKGTLRKRRVNFQARLRRDSIPLQERIRRQAKAHTGRGFDLLLQRAVRSDRFKLIVSGDEWRHGLSDLKRQTSLAGKASYLKIFLGIRWRHPRHLFFDYRADPQGRRGISSYGHSVGPKEYLQRLLSISRNALEPILIQVEDPEERSALSQMLEGLGYADTLADTPSAGTGRRATS
jgi:hypothetical protein